MAQRTYAEELVFIRLMLSGIKANTERLGKRRIDTAFITEFETTINEATTLGPHMIHQSVLHRKSDTPNYHIMKRKDTGNRSGPTL